MKWGKKYDSEYVNKLLRGIKRNTTKKFDFFCITEDKENLDSEIKTMEIDMEFKGWMRKSILFDFKCNFFTILFIKIKCFIFLQIYQKKLKSFF